MITSLEIRNYALIDELKVDFANGLTIITGETGAGKSIILGGLGLIMGQRADTKALFDSDKKCIVEAHFMIENYGLKDFFERNEFDYDDELVIRREISPSGKTRAFINDTPTKLTVLQELSRALIDLHQQFDTLDIHNVSFQLRMLDALADNQVLLNEYAEVFRAYQTDRRSLKAILDEQDRLRQEADFVAFQLNEFKEIALQENEDEALEKELKLLESAEDIKRVLGQTGVHISEAEQSIAGQVKAFLPELDVHRGVSDELDELIERINSVSIELEDLGQSFVGLAEATDSDASRLVEVQDRLSSMYKMFQKHSVTSVGELLAIEEDYRVRSRNTTQIDKRVEALQLQISSQKKILKERALELRSRRKAVVPSFLKNVHHQLAKLSMENARLNIEFDSLNDPTVTGLDQVEYLFCANKGGKMLPIKGVASGGELSRLTLVTKSLVASSIPLPTLIFDEIDSGVSGDVALRMGEILHELSANHQVVTITHSPQVASKADKHYYVFKQDLENRTATRVRELSKKDRIETIAVMLSSDPPSKPAIENAKGLLASARS